MTKNTDINIFKNQDWSKILLSLTYHVNIQLVYLKLINEKQTIGWQAEDIAMESIEKVLKGICKWDPEKSSLLTYLKNNVSKGIIANLIRSKEAQLRSQTELSDNTGSNFSIESEINAKEVLQHIKSVIKDDDIESKIFDGITDGLKKKEIIKKYKLSIIEYNNSYKRLKRKLLKANTQNLLKS